MKRQHFHFASIVLCAVLLLSACSGTAANTPTPAATAPAAQATYTIGIARWVTNAEYDRNIAAFKATLANAGYVEGVNVKYLEENPETDREKQRAIIQDFVAADVDLIYSLTTPGTLVAKELTPADLPIVFSIVTFPVETGLIESMAASGNNLVGTSNWISVDKQLFVLQSAAPDLKTIGFTHRAEEVNSTIQFTKMQAIAPTLGLKIVEIAAIDLEALARDVEAGAAQVDAFFLACDTLIQGGGEEIVIAVAKKHSLPTLSCNKSSVLKGALLGDVADLANIGSLAGEKAAQILNGAQPGDLISESQRGSHVMVNLITAEELELSIPDSLLSLASEVVR